MFCEVIIDIKHHQVNQFFDYIIPEQFAPFLVRGMRVIVPFGAQKRVGYVMKIKSESHQATKSIMDVLDVIPSLNEQSFLLIDYIEKHSTYHYASIIETLLPTAFLVTYKKSVVLKDFAQIPDELAEKFNKNGVWHLKKSDVIYKNKLQSLEKKGVVQIETVIESQTKTKYETTYRYQKDHSYQKIHNYEHLLHTLDHHQSYHKKALIDLGFSDSSINTLCKHQVFMQETNEVNREIKHVFDHLEKQITLTNHQQKAFDDMLVHHNKSKTILLNGVTGSGKTELYLKWIEKVIDEGKNVIFLVPEIMLIGMMAQRLNSKFDHVLIYHSALSKGEKHDELKKMHQGRPLIVLGTRSALFLPIDNVGLIIIDEAHDQAYIQKEQVNYHTIELAKELSAYHKAPLLLGSATPSIESMYFAQTKKYQLIELDERPFDQKLPIIHLVDMKEELKSGHASMFSRKLIQAIEETLKKKEQVIILYNRKGTAPFVLCRTCGHVPKCPHCDISLTLYDDQNILKCHYCGYKEAYAISCNICQSKTLKPVGAGIELVERNLRKLFLNHKILRMDAHTTQKKDSHEKLWHAFMKHEADILLGTQMVAKGLDFPKVTLVGVLMADLLLKVPSYLASEQAYTLLSQVSGRAGRNLPGEVIIQGYQLEHFAIQSVLKPYQYFYERALEHRKLAQYEPFMHISQVLVEGKGFLKTYQVAFQIRKQLEALKYKVLGPAPALIKKIRDDYRFNLTVKYQKIDMQHIKKIIEPYKIEDIKISWVQALD